MKLAVLTCFWRRPAVSRLYWAGIRRLRESFPALPVVAVCTDGDRENIALAQADPHATLVLAANTPLSAKQNTGMRACRRLDPDAVLKLDSDDVIGADAVQAILDTGAQVAGPADFYFYDTATARLRYWPGYPAGDVRHTWPVGSGRVFRRQALVTLEWSPWPPRKRQTGQDSQLDVKLGDWGLVPVGVTLRDRGTFALDCKNGANLWGFDTVPGETVSRETVWAHLSPAEVAALEAL